MKLVDFRLPDGRKLLVETSFGTSVIKEVDDGGTARHVDIVDPGEICKHLRRSYGPRAVTSYRLARASIQIIEEADSDVDPQAQEAGFNS